jgi:branched-chain amino acid transport system ATP-binding protein
MNDQAHERVLTLNGVTKAFGGLVTIDKLSFSITPGDRRAIIGPNGAGKTTLFNLISGKIRPTTGQIFYHGEDITNMAEYNRAAVGIARTFQITNLFGGLTVLENVLLASQALDKKRKFVMFKRLSSYEKTVDRAGELLASFELLDKRDDLVTNLSYGDQRKIEIALALAGRPRLLLLDEPTAGLSPAETRSITELLKTVDPKITVLLIEHDMDVAFAFCENISVLHFGKLLASGTREEITNNPSVQEIYLGSGLKPNYDA